MRSLEWAAPAGTPPPVFLHDSRITEVRCEKNAVTFCFADGFSLVENGQLTRAGRGLVTFSDCQPSDFFVWRVTGHPSRPVCSCVGRRYRSKRWTGAFSPVTVLSSSSPRCIPRPLALARRTLSPGKAPLAENELLYRHRDHGLLPDDVFLGIFVKKHFTKRRRCCELHGDDL